MYCPYKYKYLDLLSSQSQQSILNICFTPQLITTNILQFLHNTIGHHQWLQSKRYDIYFCQYLKLMNPSAIDYYFHTQYLLIVSSPQNTRSKCYHYVFFCPRGSCLELSKEDSVFVLRLWSGNTKHREQRAESCVVFSFSVYFRRPVRVISTHVLLLLPCMDEHLHTFQETLSLHLLPF